MKKFSLLLIPLIASCNIYSPFAQKSSTEDLVEEGRKCLHDGNFACAIEAYSAIPDAETKHEKLCSVYLAQGGLTLSLLINTVTQNSSKVLGDVAQQLLPWSATKSTALDNAKTSCSDFVNAATTTAKANTAGLLKFLSLIGHCAIRMAKTDTVLATSNSDTACNTPGNGNGTISQADIADNSNGTISSTGMCAADVKECNRDIAAMDGASLTRAGLTAIKTALDAIPTALKTDTSTNDAQTDTVRSSLRDTVR